MDMPLHAQVRRALKALIDEHFEDGQKFWTEAALAEYINVSQITIRRALADLAREGVLERKVARGTIVRKHAPVTEFSVVGVFAPDWMSPGLARVCDKFEELCHAKGRKLNLYYTHRGERAAHAFEMLVNPPEAERLVLYGNPPDITLEIGNALTARGYRFVTIDTIHPDQVAPYIATDETFAMNSALKHLMALGHRRIALLVNEPNTATSIVNRVIAFKSLTRSNGLTEAFVADCETQHWENSHEAAYNYMPRLWDSEPHPTAIIATSDVGAYAAIKWFTQRGICLPGQVSVMGFDEDLAGTYMTPTLTTVRSSASDHAALAIEVLEAPLDISARRSSHPEVIVRESTAPPPAE